MCLLKLMLCSKAPSVHPSPATLSVIPCGPRMDPNLSIQQLDLSHLSLHTCFPGHALCGKHSTPSLFQDLLWEALCAHGYRAHRSCPSQNLLRPPLLAHTVCGPVWPQAIAFRGCWWSGTLTPPASTCSVGPMSPRPSHLFCLQTPGPNEAREQE